MHPTQKICILAIDDNAINLLLIERLIKKTCPDATVLSCKNGEDAIQKFKENKVDLIFLDIELPTIDGFETARLIRECETDGGRAQIIALSGYKKDQLEEIGDIMYMDGFLRKPIKLPLLEEIIKKFITVGI
ncbi:response regulator [Salegentibacter maritimus]|uniref:response regulator n=1 Tax=Salegentibacter maritimus TaxID=2794347 RepID=UPI0018E4B8E7|nr:response regulator [Salegentibacter maritimus]MBI6117246.1 response regulator [Salegentibacter maritimus]